MILLLTLCVVFSIGTGTGVSGIAIQGCGNDGNSTLVKGYDRLYLSCYAILSSANVKWTLITDNGLKRLLATCSPNNCTSHINYGGMHVSRYVSRSYLRDFNPTSANFSGTVQCSEVRNGTEESASCNIRFTRVKITHSRIDVIENSSTTVYSHVSGYDDGAVTWSLTLDDGKTLHLGRCVDINSCTAPHSPQITLRQPSKNTGYVVIKNVQRNQAGELTCSYTAIGQTDTDSANIYIYNPATIENCQIDTIRGNWSLVLSCDVTRVFSSPGIYTFTIWERYNDFQNISRDVAVFGGQRSFRHLLSPYTDELDNKTFYRGRLTHSWRLNSFAVLYTQFTLGIYTLTTGGHASERLSKTLTVARPSRPSHNCTDLIYIPDSGVVPCECTAERLGSPEGRLIWLLGNTPIATGHYGVRRLSFPETAVSRELVVLKAVCQLDWIDSENVTLFLIRASEKAAAADGDQLKWVVYGGATVLAVVIVIVLVIVMIMLWRRGQFAKCPCHRPVYDSPEINTRSKKINTTTGHLYESMANMKNNGDEPKAVLPDGVYVNSVMMEQEDHM